MTGSGVLNRAVVGSALLALSAVPTWHAAASSGGAPRDRVQVFAHVDSRNAWGSPFAVLPTHNGVFVSTSAGSPFCHNPKDPATDVVLRYDADGGRPVASSVISTMSDMGLNGMAEDAEGRLYVVDMNGHIWRLSRNREGGTGTPEIYATDPDATSALGWRKSMWMYPVFDNAGNLYVTDVSEGAIWQIKPPGASDRVGVWFEDPRLKSDPVSGLNGIAAGPDGFLYLVLARGQIFRLPFTETPPSADSLKLFHQFALESGNPDLQRAATPGAGSVDLAFGRSGNLYVTLAAADRIAVLAPDGALLREIVDPAFNWPFGVRFQGTALLVANTHYAQNNAKCRSSTNYGEILKVSVGESGLPLTRPHVCRQQRNVSSPASRGARRGRCHR